MDVAADDAKEGAAGKEAAGTVSYSTHSRIHSISYVTQAHPFTVYRRVQRCPLQVYPGKLACEMVRALTS